MGLEADPSALREIHGWEHLLRFVFGGTVTVITGLIAQRFGPMVGGLFLAFPAILPATVTLVKKHDGRARACDDTRGAAAGSVGMIAAGAVVWTCATRLHPVLVLGIALVAWFAAGFATWWLTLRRTGR